MAKSNPVRSSEQAGRNLIKAFTCAGAILGAGVLGLVKVSALFAEEVGWLSHVPNLGAGIWWIAGGAGVGFVASWLLVRARRNSR